MIIEDGCILFAKNEVDSYYYSIGGGVHLGEKAEDAVKREVFEETGINYEIDRLAVIHENFFLDDDISKGRKCHEISFYFIMKPKGNQDLNSNSFCAEGKEYMNWIPINQLKNHTVYPTFYKDILTDLPSNIVHIVTKQY
ncbi:MAG: NUDIX domain-containing protein [Oscillospiraceae bacterium]